MITLNIKQRNFDKLLDNFLSKRRKKLQSSSISVSRIINDVKKNGDKAVLKYERKFNKNNIITPSSKQINYSIRSLDKKVKKTIDEAYERIHKFHSLQKFKNISYKDKYNNKVNYKYLPLESVGIYVPGSTASYPSSVLMSAIPAIVAKVKRIRKPFARKIQILTVLEQRAKVSGKNEQARIAKRGKEAIRKKHGTKKKSKKS